MWWDEVKGRTGEGSVCRAVFGKLYVCSGSLECRSKSRRPCAACVAERLPAHGSCREGGGGRGADEQAFSTRSIQSRICH